MKSFIFKDLNTLSGSSELLRKELGFSYITNSRGLLDSQKLEMSDKLQGVNFAEFRSTITTGESIFPSIRVPVRVVGTSQDDSPSGFSDDQDWRKYLIGGVFGANNYPGIYNENVYFNHNLISKIGKTRDFNLPYFSNEVKSINSTNSQVGITTEYFQHYSQFQNYAQTVESLTSLPNVYTLYHISSSLFDEISGVDFVDNRYDTLKNYYNIDLVQSDNEPVESKQNILISDYTETNTIYDFNVDAKEADTSGAVFVDRDLHKKYSLSPFAIKIEIQKLMLGQKPSSLVLPGMLSAAITTPFPFAGQPYKAALNTKNLEHLFLRLLKEAYNGDSQTAPSDLQFVTTVEQDVQVNEQSFLNNSITTSTQTLRVLDFPTLLQNSLITPFASNNNISTIEENEDKSFDTEGFYRSFNSEGSFELLNLLNRRANLKIDGLLSTPNTVEQFLEPDNHYEQVAFRIEKLGGAPTGDNRNNGILQNFWFFNRDEAFKFLDTQVKYNTQYTYKLYTYLIVEGLKYKTDTLRATRLLASSDSDENCLEFYDPYTGITEHQLFSDENLRGLFDDNEELRAQINNKLAAISGHQNRISAIQDNIRTKLDVALLDAKNAYAGTLSYEYKMIEFIEAVKCANPRLGCTRVKNTLDYIDYYTNIHTLIMRHFVPGLSEYAAFNSENMEEFDFEDGMITATRFEDLINALIGLPTVGSPSMQEAVAGTYYGILNSLISDILDYFSEILEILPVISALESEINDLREDINVFENELATNAQVFSSNRYMADFYIYAEPSFKIVEIPLGEKTVNIVDHPPVGLLVEPTYYKNGSKKLLFNIKRDVFSYNYLPYPTTLTELDIENKANYMQGKDLISTSNLRERSVSPERFVEVYRMSEKPSSYQDFFGNLRQTIDLKDELSGDFYGTALFEERVATNTKFYYTFRLINENGVSGPFTPIYESVLVDDGGYIYGDFVQLEESELIENRASKISIPIKKLLNIVPQQEHLEINFADFDYSDTSLNQIAGASLGQNVDDPLINSAGRKFKFRLTSKKTQKKVDINITFDYMTK